MDLLELKNSLDFIQDENGLLYKNIDGFLYTVNVKKDCAQVSVNLPQVSHNEKQMISAYLKESVLHYLKSHFVKNGVQICFNLAILDDPEYIMQFAKTFSSFLSSAAIEFSNTELDIVFDKTMFAFIPLEKPINKHKNETPPQEEKEPEKRKISTQLILIITYGIITLIYCLISVFAINIAGAVGYIMGWIPAMILVKRKYKAKTIYTCTLIVSFIALLIATIYVFLYCFLSQQDIYTAGDFILQSLTPSHCLFNMFLAYILGFFGTYSTVPAKKKEPVVEDDFV